MRENVRSLNLCEFHMSVLHSLELPVLYRLTCSIQCKVDFQSTSSIRAVTVMSLSPVGCS